MSTVESLNQYFKIAGINDDIAFVAIDYEIDSIYEEYLKDRFDRDGIGSLFVHVGDAEYLKIWVCGSAIAYNNSYCELGWSMAEIHRKIARRSKK